ncbi:hypothetical protein [Borreliella burgdorferi]
MNWRLENTYPEFLTTEFVKEETLTRSTLVKAFGGNTEILYSK